MLQVKSKVVEAKKTMLIFANSAPVQKTQAKGIGGQVNAKR